MSCCQWTLPHTHPPSGGIYRPSPTLMTETFSAHRWYRRYRIDTGYQRESNEQTQRHLAPEGDPGSGFVAAPICRQWRVGPRPTTLKLHVNRIIMTALGNCGQTTHSRFAVSEADEKIVDCAGMPLTAARRANSAGIESVSDLAKGREPGSLNRSSSRTPTAPQCDLPQRHQMGIAV